MRIRHREYRRQRLAKEGKEVRTRRVVPEETRWCPDCEQVKPLAEFPRNRSARSGFGGYCKPCHNHRGREAKIRLFGGTRDYHLRRRYGITAADVDAMIDAQGGVCAACREDLPVHVDHDHRTGRVRGVLCFLCNQALGNVRDDIGRLSRLIDYLTRDREQAMNPQVFQPPANLVIELDGTGFHRAA